MMAVRTQRLLRTCLVLLWIVLWVCALPKHLHTRITGFGSRSPLKSIFAKEASVETNTTHLYVYRSPEGLWFQSRGDGENTTLCVSMDRQGRWDAVSSCEPLSPDWIPMEGVYGVYVVPTGMVWVLITKSESVHQNDYYGEVRRVSSLELVHLSNPSSQSLSQRQLKEQARQIRLLRQALRHHIFYYSPHHDFTHSLQRRILSMDDNQPDLRFYWNQPSVQVMLDTATNTTAAQLFQQHVIPVTSAFVGIQAHVNLTSHYAYDQILISRRSRFRAGTRFTKRGADATGAVANYAETEQQCWLYHTKNHTLKQVSSFIQTRGSIPLRWSSPADVKTYRPRVRIGTDPLAQARAVKSHVQSEFSLYGTTNCNPKQPQLVFVNLIDKKKDQGRLGRAFDAVLQAVLDVYDNSNGTDWHPDTVRHTWFDFHAEVKNGKWSRLEYLLRDVTPTLEEQDYFCAIPQANGTWTVLNTQRGVVRTNCMDCLDRTNVVQSIFGRYMLYRQLENLRTNKKRSLPLEHAVAFRRNPLSLPWTNGEVSHRLLWADNADAISKLYAGTPALKGDFTRTGQRTKRGALDDGMNSLQRYYLNNFLDADRQEGMDLMVGYADFSTDDAFDPDSLKRTRSRLLSSSEESRYALIKQRKRPRISTPKGLDLRWLPGDLQSHLKSHALGVTKETKETLESMDQRSASDLPWWVATEDSSSDGGRSEDDEATVSSVANTGHVVGALVAAMQAPTTTATAIVCMLALANAAGSRSANDKQQ